MDDKEILDRKKAWAELEREQTDLKRNVKSLFRFEPGARAIDDPALAQRVTGARLNPQTYETAEDKVFEKKINAQGLGAAKSSPQAEGRNEVTPSNKMDDYTSNKKSSSGQKNSN